VDRAVAINRRSAYVPVRRPAAAGTTLDSVPAIRGPATARADRRVRARDGRAVPQLGRRGVIAVWAAAAVPMGLFSWVGGPLLADQLSGPGRLARALIITMTAGLVWQFALVMILVRREQGTLRWSALRETLWLRAPRSPRSGRRGGGVWLVVVPLCFAFALIQLVPGLPHPAGRDLGKFLESHTGHALLEGSWGWFAVLAVMFVFNTVLGEELLFRGYLLPRMNGAFGNRDWLANGVLFGVYHLHMPWAIPASIFDAFIFAYPSKRYRSALIGIAVHSAQSVVFIGLTLSLVLKG
jgi:CAAX protease family protein